jgi:subtilisin family serine protease
MMPRLFSLSFSRQVDLRGIMTICLLLLSITSFAQAKYLDPAVKIYAEDRFIVKVFPEVGDLQSVMNGATISVKDLALTQLNQKWSVTNVERLFVGPPETDEAIIKLDLPGYWRFWVDKPLDRDALEAALADYNAASIVEHVEPVGIHRVNYSPNDPSWTNQWYIRSTAGDHDIDAVEAWDIQRGDSAAILGITDTGVLYTHPDLRTNIWRNWAEKNGTTGVDDDGNGFVDDSVGYDFVSSGSSCWSGEDCTTPDNNPTDFNGHGTHVSGISAAVTNNSTGGAGIAGGGGTASGARIMPLRIGWSASWFGQEVGYVGMDYAASAFNYGRIKGVCALNCSWGNSNSGGLGAATDAAILAGIVICVAAGNDNDQVASYLCSRTDCIAISATDANDVKASFSSYGTWVDVSAPGVSIYSTVSNHGTASYDYYDGTSMATPCVTGEVGLLKSHHPTWNRTQIIPAITGNVDNIYDENPSYSGLLGSGRINLNLALLAGGASITVTAPNGGETWYVGTSQNITWTSTGVTGNIKIELNRSYSGGAWETLFASIANDGTEPWTVAGTTTTSARIRISSVTTPSILDESNANFTIASPFITVTAPNGGETWYTGFTQNINWTSAAVSGNIKIELNRSYSGGTWDVLFASIANDGSETWTITSPTTTTARVRVSSVSAPTVLDISDANFTIANPTVTVTSPNGAETWIVGDVNTISWSSTGLPENVKVELNRTYPGVTWETLFASTANDGSEAWTVTSSVTSTARIRIIGVVHTTIGDTSNANFTIGTRSLIVTSPNGGENWIVGDPHNITWTSQNLTGNVAIDLNRAYSGGSWESLTLSTPNSGSFGWTVTAAVTTAARIRVTSLSYPAISDFSNADFTIAAPNLPPSLTHDYLHDQNLVVFPVTALVTDDVGGFVTRFFYKLTGAVNYDSLLMNVTGNPDEYAATVGPLAAGSYDYYLKVRDAGGLISSTTPFTFNVGGGCGTEQAYDDGTAERSNWSNWGDFAWAVKFTGTAPYVLCNARIGISVFNPGSSHSPIQVQVLNADGLGGLPGTVVQTRTVGSIGNVVGGLVYPPANWDLVIFNDGFGNPLQLNGDFYIAVSNPDTTKIESFLQDTSSAYANRSYVFDPCDQQWYNESGADTSCRRGNRMIRASGLSLIPPNVVIRMSGNDIILNWNSTGAPTYLIYSDTVPTGAFTTYEGSSATTTFIDVGVLNTNTILFYRVKAQIP